MDYIKKLETNAMGYIIMFIIAHSALQHDGNYF